MDGEILAYIKAQREPNQPNKDAFIRLSEAHQPNIDKKNFVGIAAVCAIGCQLGWQIEAQQLPLVPPFKRQCSKQYVTWHQICGLGAGVNGSLNIGGQIVQTQQAREVAWAQLLFFGEITNSFKSVCHHLGAKRDAPLQQSDKMRVGPRIGVFATLDRKRKSWFLGEQDRRRNYCLDPIDRLT